jgi:putative Ca2+/H+ antiporter (TMEM165/GDT1 family)
MVCMHLIACWAGAFFKNMVAPNAAKYFSTSMFLIYGIFEIFMSFKNRYELEHEERVAEMKKLMNPEECLQLDKKNGETT